MPAHRMELTDDLVTRADRREADPGPDPGTREPEADDYVACADALLAGQGDAPVWIFAYGSLIWNPTFEAVEARRAVAQGWHRRFCLTLHRWRGSRDRPALMLALDRGGACAGVAYRLDPARQRDDLIALAERELDAIPPTNRLRWIRVASAGGPLRAVAVTVDRQGAAYAGQLDEAAVAAILARGAGHWGTAADYLRRTVAGLEAEGIHDRHLWRLQRLVAAELRRMLDAPFTKDDVQI